MDEDEPDDARPKSQLRDAQFRLPGHLLQYRSSLRATVRRALRSMSLMGSTSAVSGFLRHGCSPPETGHLSAPLARQKSAITGREHMQQIAALFDHLVGEDVEICRDYDAEGFGALAINYEVEFRRLFDWQVAGLGTLNDLVDERRSSTIEFLQAVAVAHERSSFGVFPRAEDGRQPCPEHELGDRCAGLQTARPRGQ